MAEAPEAPQYAPWQQALVARRDELTKARTALQAQAGPLRAKRDELAAQMAPLEAAARELTQKIHAIERPALVDVDNELASIARALGAKSLAAN